MSIFAETLSKLGKQMQLNISSAQLEKCEKYYRLVYNANQKLNLTRITGEAHSAERHFAHAMLLDNVLEIECGATVIDIGTGAGFPGVPLYILRPDLNVSLLDSSIKKTNFLRDALQSLALNINVICARAEDVARTSLREHFDIALSRALAPLPVLLEFAVPLLRNKGVLCAWKGKSYKQEVEESVTAINTLSCAPAKSVPVGDGALLLIEKQKSTPDKFPRRFSKIKSSPLLESIKP